MADGVAYFVLPSLNNQRYIIIPSGSHFGIIDILGSSQIENFEVHNWNNH